MTNPKSVTNCIVVTPKLDVVQRAYIDASYLALLFEALNTKMIDLSNLHLSGAINKKP